MHCRTVSFKGYLSKIKRSISNYRTRSNFLMVRVVLATVGRAYCSNNVCRVTESKAFSNVSGSFLPRLSARRSIPSQARGLK